MCHLKLACLLSAILCFIALSSCSSEQTESQQTATTKKPNIVLIVGDDQGYPYFGFMGADYVKTPNMDVLAASGTVFTNAYVPANHCRPSLQSLMTGTLPVDYAAQVSRKLEASKETSEYKLLPAEKQAEHQREFGFHAMQHFNTLPRMLNEAGYVSFQGGKWWEYNYQNGGFSEGMTTGWKSDQRDSNWFKEFMGGDGLALARATMQPVYDFVDKHSEQPFFIWYAPELPHYPFDAPDRYYDLYRDADMSESAKRYYANCTWFDDGVGELVAYLKKKGEFDNTLFVYVNDNGWEQNPHQEFRHDSLRWHNGGDKGKLSMVDQSFRTPVIFSLAGQIKPARNTVALIHSIDILPTILDYAGLDIPSSVDGQSFRPVIDEQKSMFRTTIVGHVHKLRSEEDMMGRDVKGFWLREKQWFFKWNLTDNIKALYDVESDPGTDHDLAAGNPALVEEFVGKIETWRSEKGL